MSSVKQQMIDIATETARKGGVQAITMRDLGEAVGIKSSSVMYHFKNKNGLLLAIVDSYSRLFFEHLERLDSESPRNRLMGLTDLFEEALNTDRMCLCGMLAADSSQLDNTTRASTRNFFSRMETWVRNALIEAGNDKHAAPLIVSSLEGAMLLDRMEENNERLNAVRDWLRALVKT